MLNISCNREIELCKYNASTFILAVSLFIPTEMCFYFELYRNHIGIDSELYRNRIGIDSESYRNNSEMLGKIPIRFRFRYGFLEIETSALGVGYLTNTSEISFEQFLRI